MFRTVCGVDGAEAPSGATDSSCGREMVRGILGGGIGGEGYSGAILIRIFSWCVIRVKSVNRVK